MANQTNITNKSTITNPYLYANVWGCRWIDGEVSYSFGSGLSPTSPYGITVSEASVAWSAPEQQALRDALQNYMNVCNVRFVERAFDSGNTTNLVAWKVSSNVLGNETSGMFEVPDGSKAGANTLNGYFNTSHADWSNFTVGGSGFELLMHELGHSVGLAHPHDGGGGESPRPYPGINIIEKDWRDMGTNYLNQGIWSTMSYNDGWLKTASGADTGLQPATNKSYGYQATPMAFDVAALQFLYGANMQYHTGDDTYTLTQANVVGTGWTCIWDAGGIDTITNVGATLACTIDLREATLTNSANGGGYVSFDQGIAGGFTIANGAVIENAIGGNGADTLTGNAARNALKGNAGNDLINGVVGTDTAIFNGNYSGYVISQVSGGLSVADQVGADGMDTLANIVLLQFADQTRMATTNAAGVFRFYNQSNGTHFYTGTESEAVSVAKNLASFGYEGVAFSKNVAGGADSIDVFRFYNSGTGSHFYTANEAEKNSIIANMPAYSYEGTAYQAHSQQSAGTTALYRFYNTQTGSHFYTASEAEMQNVKATLAGIYNFEGVAYYVDVA